MSPPKNESLGGVEAVLLLDGAGGGSGGAIYLQAPQILGSGMLLAQGGGGGGATDVATQGLGGDGGADALVVLTRPHTKRLPYCVIGVFIRSRPPLGEPTGA